MTEVFESYAAQYPQCKQLYEQKRGQGEAIMNEARNRENVEAVLNDLDTVMDNIEEQLKKQTEGEYTSELMFGYFGGFFFLQNITGEKD